MFLMLALMLYSVRLGNQNFDLSGGNQKDLVIFVVLITGRNHQQNLGCKGDFNDSAKHRNTEPGELSTAEDN